MVRLQDYGGSAAPLKSKRQAAGKKKRTESEVGEGSAPLVESGPSAIVPALPSIEERPAEPTSLPVALADAGRAGEGEEEKEEEMPLLKRRRLVRLADLPSRQASQKEKGKKKKGEGEKGKKKAVTGSADQWESLIRVEKTASIADVDVSLRIAEKVITPTDEEFMERFSDVELGPRLVRSCMRGLTFAFDAHKRIERLDSINRSQNKEILDLTERVRAVGDELLEVKEERDLLRAQHSSIEEEKKSWEMERKILHDQLIAGKEEKSRLEAEKDRLAEEFRKEMMVVRERSTKFLMDCQKAIEGKCRTEDMLRELRCSVKQQRIEAIKRWKRRNLNAECLELACDVTLSVLRKCHEVHFPAGSDGPSFEDYSEPLLPALGLSLEEMKEKVEGEQSEIPDEELDLDSEEEEEDVPPSSSPPDPVVDPSPPLVDSAVIPSSADPVVMLLTEAILPTSGAASSEPVAGSSSFRGGSK